MSKNDAKIKELLERVEGQKAGLGTKPRANWETNGIFKYKDGSNFFNLNTVKDSQVLISALALLLEKDLHRNAAAEKLGVDVKPFEWDGYTVAEWQKDFKQRIEIVKWQAKKAQLDKTKKKLNSLVSEETRTEMELDDIASMLDD